MTHRHLLIACLLSTATTSCSSPAGDAPKAKVEDVKTADAKTDAKADAKADAKTDAKAPAQPAAPGTLALDASQSAVEFVGAKVTASHEGTFEKVEGTATLDGDVPKAVEITVHVGSLKAEPEKLQAHLLSDDFFAAEKFPTATFRSTRIEPKATADGTHEVTGELTIRGTTKQVTFPARIEVTPSAVRGTAKFAIDRKDFGIVYPGMKDDLIKDEVLLDLNLVFPRS